MPSPSIEHISAQYDGVSGPLLMTIPYSYEQARVRLMIIGQQNVRVAERHRWT